MKKEIPALMSTMMVQAILEDRKTMTRRLRGLDEVNKEPDKVEFLRFQEYPDGSLRAIFQHEDSDEPGSVKCPYGRPGDLLWVRETWARQISSSLYMYKASGDVLSRINKWKPSIHMPKEAARIWLEVTDIRVERLQDILEDDATAEGIQHYFDEHSMRYRYKDYLADAGGYGHPDHDYPTVGIPVTSFSTLWRKINGEESWDLNPWVWVVSFKVLSRAGKPKL